MAQEHTDLCNLIIDMFNAAGAFAYKNNTGQARMRGFTVRFGYPGSSDIYIFMPGGKTVFVEVKVGKDKARDDQKIYKARMENLGFQYIEARSIDDVMPLYKAMIYGKI